MTGRDRPARAAPLALVIWTALAVATGMTAFSAHAQTGSPPTPPSAPGREAPSSPGAQPPPAGSQGTPRGVIRPPAGVDPEMNKGAPNPGAFPTPVIPPPGSGGNQPSVVPK